MIPQPSRSTLSSCCPKVLSGAVPKPERTRLISISAKNTVIMMRITFIITPPPMPSPPFQISPALSQKFSMICISGSFCLPSIKPLLAIT